MNEQWTEEDAAIVAKVRDLEWQQGDRLRHAVMTETKRGGAKTVAAVATQRDPSELTRIVKVCEAFADTRRRYDLTLARHDAVLELATDAERDGVLAQAVRNGWSARQTRKQVLMARIAASEYQPVIDDDPDDTAFRSIGQSWNRAPTAAREMFLSAAEEANLGEIDL